MIRLADEYVDKPAPKAIHLRSLSPAHAKAQDALARAQVSIDLTAAERKIVARIEKSSTPFPDTPWLNATLDGHDIALQVNWGLARRIVGTPLEGADPEDAAVLLEDALAPWLDEVEARVPLALRFREVSPHVAANLTNALNMTLALGTPGSKEAPDWVHIPLILSPGAVERLLATASPRSANSNDSNIKIRVFVDRDGAVLTALELLSLRSGDAITLSSPLGEGQGLSWRVVIEDQVFAPAYRVSGGVCLEGPFQLLPPPPLTPRHVAKIRKDESMTSDKSDGPQAAPPDIPKDALDQAGDSPVPDTDLNAPEQALASTAHRLEGLEVRVSFRAGEVMLDLAALNTLAPGAILKTTDTADAQVDLVVNGQVFATGELIDIAGLRAVEVKTLST